MDKLVNILKRAFGLAFFALVCFFAVLYGLGKFDFVFLEREIPISGKGDAVIELPQMSEDDKQVENIVSQMGVGENLSGVASADKTPLDDEEKKPVQGVELPNYPLLESSLAEGYYPSSERFSLEGGFILSSIVLNVKPTRDHVKGEKDIIIDSPVSYEEGGEYFYASDVDKAYRFSFETYMGYIIANQKTTLTIYNLLGQEIYNCNHSELMPAYIRDSRGNPLFYDENKKLFYLDESGRKMYSDYIDQTDSIGLYFDYSEKFGKSDSDLLLFNRLELVDFVDEIDMKDSYILSSIDSELAYYIYLQNPSYANRVARSNPRFAIALAAAKKQIEEEERLLQEKENELLTADTETMTEPESESDTPSEESSVDSTLKEDITTYEESTAVPETEQITEKEPENTSDTESEISNQTSGQSTDDVVPESTETSETVSKDPNILLIERTLELVRYAYGPQDVEYADSLDYRYAKAYNFSEGRAAVVDDRGVLRYINAAGETVIDGTGTKMVTSSRYITTEYAEPLYRHSENSKGYLYFDGGLVRVRRIERDYTFRNIIYSDSDVLLCKDGSEFKLPHGYTLVSYSEDVLVLRGQNGKYGYYHKNGYWIAQPVYTDIKPFSEGLGVIGFKGGKKGVIDAKGNIIIPFAYEYITSLSGGIMTLYDYEEGWTLLAKMAK